MVQLLVSQKRTLWFFLPIIVVPNRMVKKIFQQRCPSESTCQWQMPFWRLVDMVNKLGRTKPSFFAFDFAVLRCPANLTAKLFKISFALFPLSFLHRETKFTPRKFVPESLNGGQIFAWNIFDIGKVHKITPFGFGPGNRNESVAGELIDKERNHRIG